MELDELQQRWAVQDLKLDEVLRLNRQFFRANQLARVKSALEPLRAGLLLEVGVSVLAVAALGVFLFNNASQLRFALPAVVLDVAAIAFLALTGRQLHLAAEVDFAGPVTSSQRQLEALRLLRIRVTKWVLLLSPLLWTPLLLVGLRALQVDAYAALGVRYLLANLLFGVAFVGLMRWAAGRWANRLQSTGWARRWAEALAGHSLTAARAQLASIADFEREGELSESGA